VGSSCFAMVIADEQEASTFENTKEELASFKDQC